MKRSAFTLVEVLVAIGIIVLLVGMLIIGGKYVFGASQARDTTVAFETLKSLENEMKLAAVSSPATWVWWDVTEVDPRQPTGTHRNSALDFWKVPWRGNSSAVPAATDVPSPLDAPGSVSQDSPARSVSRAVINTSLAMAQLSKVPANRSAIQSLPTEKVLTPAWTDNGIADPGTDGVLGTSDDGSMAGFYPAGVRVKHGGNIYTCNTSHAASSSATPPDTEWTQSADNSPLLLDGWGNPIIYVPPAGLMVRVLGDKSANDPSDTGQTYLVVSPDNQSFWASAGADGIFWTGDDNLYSFDN